MRARPARRRIGFQEQEFLRVFFFRTWQHSVQAALPNPTSCAFPLSCQYLQWDCQWETPGFDGMWRSVWSDGTSSALRTAHIPGTRDQHREEPDTDHGTHRYNLNVLGSSYVPLFAAQVRRACLSLAFVVQLWWRMTSSCQYDMPVYQC